MVLIEKLYRAKYFNNLYNCNGIWSSKNRDKVDNYDNRLDMEIWYKPLDISMMMAEFPAMTCELCPVVYRA